MDLMGSPARIPLWLKIGWTVWLAVWIPLYAHEYGARNFLWFCDLANLLIGVALWRESAFLFSWQACSVLLVQIAFSIDVAWRFFVGSHLFGGTGYMFDPAIPLGLRLLSLFHVVTPPLLFWALRRLGYDRRGMAAATACAWVLLPICWFGWDHTVNLNWVWGPFEKSSLTLKPAWLHLLACLAAYPLLLYLPTHLALARFFGKPRSV